MFCNCALRLFWAAVQFDPDPEIVGVVKCSPPMQYGPHFSSGLGIMSVCGSDCSAKTEAKAGSKFAGTTWAETLATKASPRSTVAHMKLTPRPLVMATPFMQVRVSRSARALHHEYGAHRR